MSAVVEPAGIRGPRPTGRLQRRVEPNRVQSRQTSRSVDGPRARDRSQNQIPRPRSLHSVVSSNWRASWSGGRESSKSSPEVPCYFLHVTSVWLHGSTHRRRSGTTCTPHSHAAHAANAVEQSGYTHTHDVHFNTPPCRGIIIMFSADASASQRCSPVSSCASPGSVHRSKRI